MNKKYKKLNKIASVVFWTLLYCSSDGHFFFFPLLADNDDEDTINNIIKNLKSLNNNLNSVSVPPILKIKIKK